ncbi:hypothetical protein D3C87_624600 [compost metagenome]
MSIKELISAFLIIAILYIVIGLLWMALEKLFYGRIESRLVDDIFTVILAVSIYLTLKS